MRVHQKLIQPDWTTGTIHRPVTLTLTSRQRSWVTATVDLLVTTPLFTVLGMRAVVLEAAAAWPSLPSLPPLLWPRSHRGSPPEAVSAGPCRKSRTSWSQSKMRKTRRLLRTTVKQEDSRVDLRAARQRHGSACAPRLPPVPVVQLQLQRRSVAARSGRLEDAVEHVGLGSLEPPLSTAVAGVVGQQGVRHQVDGLGAIGESLKQQLRLHEVKPADRNSDGLTIIISPQLSSADHPDLASERLGWAGLGLSRSSRLTSIMSTSKDIVE